jgi:flavin-dependent dehydrogenase
MALSNYLPNSRISQAGVCTSSTRPVSPYEGQVIYETDTNRTLVWNNAAWIGLAQSGDAGLVLMRPTVSGSGVSISGGKVTATAASEAIMDNCFTSDFDFYRVLIRYQTSTTNSFFMQMRTGSTNAATNYNYSEIQAYLGFGVTVGRSTAQTQAQIGANSNGAFWQMTSIDIFGPKLSEPTTYSALNSRNDANYTNISNYVYNGTHTTATSYESLRVLVTSGTFTGTILIYGYNQ